jgi:hypothetical protein
MKNQLTKVSTAKLALGDKVQFGNIHIGITFREVTAIIPVADSNLTRVIFDNYIPMAYGKSKLHYVAK